MLVIRMQRTGRKGHAMFRLVVQDSRRTPTSGKVVAQIGSYDPHSKSLTIDKDKVSFYLDNGAQPSDRVVGLLKQESIKLPSWVSQPVKKERAIRNPEKRRSTAPETPVEQAPAEASTEQPVADQTDVAPKESAQTADTETQATEPIAEAESADTETKE